MFLHVSSGRGPVECERAVVLFAHSLIKELQKLSIPALISRQEAGSIPGCCKSIVISLNEGARLPPAIEGSMLWICQSSYRKGVKRKNWYIQCSLRQDYTTLSCREEKISFTTMRCPGAGGQNVNKVETGVRAIYQPLGLSVVVTKQPSQKLNKKLAVKMLNEKVDAKNQKLLEQYHGKLWSAHNSLERGNALRIYEGANFIRIK